MEPLLPKGLKAGRPPVWCRRRLIAGIRFRVRTGVPRRDVPAVYGPWGRIYDLFRRWPLAIACMAYDNDFPIEVDCEYLPKELLQFGRVGEVDA